MEEGCKCYFGGGGRARVAMEEEGYECTLAVCMTTVLYSTGVSEYLFCIIVHNTCIHFYTYEVQ